MVRETRHLWVGNIPETVREDRIRDHFKRSTEDVSPPNFDQRSSGYYERSSSRIVTDTDQYIRRPNNYHSGDIRGRPRDRPYRNGPYSSVIDRSTPVGHHRVPSWYDTSPSSGGGGGSTSLSGAGASPAASSRTVYGNVASAVVQPDTSNNYDCQILKNKKKSRSGSESPCGIIVSGGGIGSIGGLSDRISERLIDRTTERRSIDRLNSSGSSNNNNNNNSNINNNATSSHSSHNIVVVDRGNNNNNGGGSAASSRSHSRSPSSCSSTNSTSSNSHASSPVSGSDPPPSSSTSSSSTQRTSSSSRHNILQSIVSATSQSGMICNNNNNNHSNNILNASSSGGGGLSIGGGGGGGGSSSSSSTGCNNNNPVVHSEDNRPLAICVRNLPARSSDTSLKDGLFHEYKKHGKVTWVKVVGQNSERYALVCFKKPDDVEKALEVSHDKLFFGCKIEVAPYQGYDVEDNEFRPYEAELDEYHPKSTRTLFIGNLEKDITGSELRKHFECFGEIIEIDIKKQGMNAYAFCQYSDIISVVKAMRKMDGEHLGTNRIKLGFGKSMPTNCVWIDGVTDSVSENHLSGQFSRYGPVSQVVIDRERKLALVSFEQIQYAQTAVKEMRGATLRGRKLQVDFASRECQEAFYDKLDKQQQQQQNNTGSNSTNQILNINRNNTTSNDINLNPDITTTTANVNLSSSCSSVVSVPGQPRFNRYESQSRSRASSFSGRHNLNSTVGGVGGAVSPSNTPGSVGSGCSGSGSIITTGVTGGGNITTTPATAGINEKLNCNVGGTTPRGGRSRSIRHGGGGDYEFTTTATTTTGTTIPDNRRFRSYDEYSPSGSGASHDDEATAYYGREHRSNSPQSRLGPIVGSSSGSSIIDTLEISSSNSGRRRCDKSPGDIRNLQKERFHLLEQLEECPSSGDELVSPKKRMKFDHSSHHHNHHHTISSFQPQSTQIDCANSNNSNSLQQPTKIGDSNCDVLGNNHSNETATTVTTNCSSGGVIHNHRKCVEVRRLSECNSLKYGTQILNCNSNNSRRPSTDAGTLNSCSTIINNSSNINNNNNNNINSSNNSSNSIRPTTTTTLLHNINSSGQQHDHHTIGNMNTTISGTNITSNSSIQYSSSSHLPCKRRRTVGGNSVTNNAGSGMSISSSAIIPTTNNSNSITSGGIGSSTTTDGNEYHTSRGRGHQLHSHHSHEASGGESADGSRPGTPLCDERPEVLPSEPRRIPRDRPHEPMMLPLPKWGIPFFQQHRVIVGTTTSSHTGQIYSSNLSSSINISNNNNLNNLLLSSSSSSLLSSNNNNSHSSLLNSLSSPPLLAGTRLSSSFHPGPSPLLSGHSHLGHHFNHSSSSSSQHHHHHSNHYHNNGGQQSSLSLSQQQQSHHSHHHHNINSNSADVEKQPTSPLRARSLSSNSSDSSEAAPISTSPSIEERIKTLDEWFEKWSGNSNIPTPVNPNTSVRSHTLNIVEHHNTGSNNSSSCSGTPTNVATGRHKFLDLDVHELKPSEIVKSVLAKKSIFDDDLQRLKNISDKYEPPEIGTKPQIGATSPALLPNLAATKTPIVGGPSALSTAITTTSIPTNLKLPTIQSTVFPAPALNTLQRLNSSPMNSPQTSMSSPYNSPSPSPVVVSTATNKVSTLTQPIILTPQPAKGLQYPFPSHPPAVSTCANISSSLPNDVTTTTLSSEIVKPKPNSITKSFSVPGEKSSSSPTNILSSSSTTPNRSLSKSNSIPGSTNIGTLKTSVPTASGSMGSQPINNKVDDSDVKFQLSSSHNQQQSGQKSSLAPSSQHKKNDKPQKHNHRNENEKKASKTEKSRGDSIDRRKTNSTSETVDTHEQTDKQVNEKQRQEEELSRKKELEEKEERERREMALKERQERERLEKEKLQRQEKERLDRDRREKELKKREKEEKDREEKDKREREDKDRKEKEERERKEKEEWERKQIEDKKLKELERREKEDLEHKEREERDSISAERKDTDERHRREKYHIQKTERLSSDDEIRLNNDELLKSETSEHDKSSNTMSKEYRKETEFPHFRHSSSSSHHHHREEKQNKENSENIFLPDEPSVSSQKRKDRKSTCVSGSTSPVRQSKRRLSSPDSLVDNTEDHTKRIKTLSTPCSDENRNKILDRRDSKDPNNSKSSSMKHNSSSSHSSNKVHNRISTSSVLNTVPNKLIDEKVSAVGMEERFRKDSGFDEKKCNKDNKEHITKREHHRTHSNSDKTSGTPSTHKHKKHQSSSSNTIIKEEKDFTTANTLISLDTTATSVELNNEKDDDMSSFEKPMFTDSHDLRSTDDDEILQQHTDHHHNRERKLKKEYHKDKKRHVDYDDENSHKQQHDLEEMHHQHHLTSGRSLDSTSTKKHDNNRHHERKISSRSEDGALSKQQHLRHHQHQESRNKMTPTSSRKLTLSSDDSNSDEPKKHSIFDIPDDGPYISMYDKVKARSCKNMQKQEEEKKIKAKFSQLKQCRAKREEKKRSTSYDGDSDSDFDGEHPQHHRHHQKYRTGFKHNRSGISTSDEDHDDNDSSTHNPQQRDSVISDSDSEGARRRQYRARLNELCDDDDSSDDDDIHPLPQRRRSGDISSCKKISSKRSSRGTRIASDTTDSDGENKNQSSQKLSSKSENHVEENHVEENDTEDNLRYCDNYVMNCINDDIKFKSEIKREIMENNNNNHQNSSNIISGDNTLIKSEKIKNEGDSLSSIGSNTTVGNLKVEVKLEIKEPTNREFFSNPQHENISESDNICSTTDNNNKESIYDQLFTPENRKKHKKSKKRQKTPIPSADNNTINVLTQQKFGVDLDKAATSTMEHVFDELKRESMLLQIPTTPTSSVTASNPSVDQQQSEQEALLCQQQQYSEKKKHKERKDRKREKYHHHHRNNDEYVDKNTLTKEERHRLKKSKKASKSGAGIIGQNTSTVGCNVGNSEQTSNRYGSTFTSASTKRNDEKMEDIFGPISDDESQMSPNESVSLTGVTIKKEPTNSNNLFETNNNFGSSVNSTIPIITQQPQQTQITAAVNPYKQEPLTPKSHTVEENEENKQKVNQSHLERERHRKEKREKKRKEREKSREQHALATLQSKMNDDENSVDLDEAGRVLEAQLMADSDSKQNDEPQQLETPSTATTYKSDMTDVFRFSDGDENSMEIVSHEKKDIQDHHKNKEKKKKKKRSKEERHHQKREHHHHISTNTNNNNAMMSPPSAGQQQSNKLSILISTPNDETQHRESPLSKPSPSLPSLMDDDGPLLSSPVIPTTPDHSGCKQNELNLSISPIGREKIMISPIPKTPTISAAKQAELKKKPDKFIPGFDGDLDEKISESAVQSISAEFTSPIIDSVPEEPKIPIASPPESSKLTSDKLAAEEKSRVVISQEETEDAVAALLGESFGNSSAADYSFTDEPIDAPVEEVDTVQVPIVSVIAEEEAEEMRKAVQSLGAEDIDIKADTPQSEQDLQIDTDTEEPDEDGSYNLRFDNCPKTPDIDLSSIGKPVDETIKSERQTASNTTSVITKSNSDEEKASSDKEVKNEKQAENLLENIKPPKIESLTTNQTSVKTETDQINQANIVTSIHSSSVRSQIVQSTPIALPQISVPIKQQTSCVTQQQQQQQQPIQKQNQILQNRSQGQYSMQPPTITIPEQSHFAYPPINVVVSPRSTAGDHRLQSPRQHQSIGNQQSIQQHPNHPNSPYAGNLRVQSPHSPILHRGGQQNQHGMRHSSQLSPVTAQHVVIQQRQILSSSPGSNTASTSNANLVLNRMPMTTVLTPISKSMQPTSIMLPQPSSGQTSVIGRQVDHHQTHSQQHPQQELKIQPGQTLAYQSTRVNVHPQQGAPIQGAIQIGSQKHIVHSQQQQQIKTIIQPQGAQIQGGMQIGHGPPQQQQHIKTVIEGHTVQPGQMPHQTIILQQSGTAGGKQMHHPQHQQQQRLSPQQMTKMSQQQFLHQHLIQQQQQQQRQQIHNMQQQNKLHHQQQQQQHTAQMIHMQKMQQSQLHIPQQPKSTVPQHISQSHRVVHQQQPPIQTHQYQQQSPTNIKQDSHNQHQQSSIIQSMTNKDTTLSNSQPVNTTIHQNVVIMRQQHSIHPAQDQQLTHCSQAIGHQQQSSPTTTIPSNAILQKQHISTMAPLPIQTITQNKQQHLPTQLSGNVQQTHSANSPVGQVKLVSKSENVQLQPTVQVIKPVVNVGCVVPPTVTIPSSISQPHTILNKHSSGIADEPAEQQISTITAEKVSHKETDIKSQIKLDVEKLGKLSEKPTEMSESVKSSSDPLRENIPQITKDISPKKSLENDKSIDLKSIKNSQLIVKESDNISVIRSQSAATPVQPIIKEKSLLTEENVIKLTSEPLLVDQIEQDSKEDSDYWSAKEIIIESVIKKNDTVVCDDKKLQSKQIAATTDIVSAKLDDDDKKCVEEIRSENLSSKSSSTEALSSNEQISNDTTKSEPETRTPPTDSSEKNDDTHDEEEFDENQSESGTDTGSNSNVKPIRGGKQRGRGGGGRGGKKLTAIVHPFVQTSPNTTTSTSPPTTIEGVQTRRGKIANQTPTRGRKGRPPTKAINVPTVGEKKMRNQQMQQQLISSDQDVYEFHDDSGEETSSKTSSTGGGDRPRLILTIKSPGQSSVGSVSTSTTTTTASNVLTTTDQNPAANQVKEKPPTITVEDETITNFNTDVASPLGNQLPPPSPASAASQDSQRDQKDIISDFQQPAAGGAAANTRKSRRLQEKDRSTVDDVIEDVVRNTLNSPKGGQTPPRRSTRNAQNITPAKAGAAANSTQQLQAALTTDKTQIVDGKKSPRANRRTKDRKSSDASVDSSDEKLLLSKADAKIKTLDEDPLLQKSEPDRLDNSADDKISETKLISSISTESSESVKPELSATMSSALINKEAQVKKPGDPTESPLTLIDPVTGVLTVVCQSKEGQYVPIGGRSKSDQLSQQLLAPPTSNIVVNKHIPDTIVKEVKSAPTADDKQKQQMQINKSSTETSSLIGTSSVADKAHISSASTVVVTNPKPINVTTTIQQQMTVSSPATSVIATTVPIGTPIISQQPPNNKAQPIVIQPQLPQQQAIRTHPLKAHVLNSQMNKQAMSTQQSQQVQLQQQQHQNIVVSGAVTLNQSQQNIQQSTPVLLNNPNHVIQSNIVVAPSRHLQSSDLQQQQQHSPKLLQQQHGGMPVHSNLIVNIPSSNSPHLAPILLSPRMQQQQPHQHNVVIKNQQQPQQHIVHQIHQQNTSSVQQQPPSNQTILHVISKQNNQQSHHNQQILIHSNKQIPQQQQQQSHPYSTTTVVQGGKIIQQQQSVTIQAGGKHQTIQVPIQQPQHNIHQKIQQQPPVGGVSVVQNHQLSKRVDLPSSQQQPQHHSVVSSGAMTQQQLQQLANVTNIVQSGRMEIQSGGGVISGSQQSHIYGSHQQHQQSTGATMLQSKPTHQLQHQQQIVAPPTTVKGVIGLHQTPQIMTGAVASPPPLKQSPHMPNQQPVVTGASSLRVSVPPISPQGQQTRGHLLPGLPIPGFDANLHDIGNYSTTRSKSPPPAHQQASPITPGDGTYSSGSMRGVSREYIMYQYIRDQARIPYNISRSSMDPKELSEVEDKLMAAASPPLELRRPGSGSRQIAVPHSLQSPQDRATDSPQVAQVYVHGTRIPHPHYPDVGARYFENVRPMPAEPPPAHRPPSHSGIVAAAQSHSDYVAAAVAAQVGSVGNPGGNGTGSNVPLPSNLGRIQSQHPAQQQQHQKTIEREQREQREREKERMSIPAHTSMPSHGSLVPVMPGPTTGRSLQVQTPPHGSQVPPQADSLLTLLQRYPVMWQGLLALKTDQAAVQMHFVFGNPHVARGSLPCNSDGSTPPLRIAQRMRLEQTQLEGVAKKMQSENEHCMLLALPCGRDHMDVLQQSRNLQTGFITYLQQKMAAGIVNIPVPGSDQAAYVVHIFPSCEFANENLERAAPDLKHRVAEIAHLLIVIATV